MELKDQIGEQVYTALRSYQQDALLTINRYISSGSTKQSLIKMPMGTGKTTLIAVTCSLLQSVNSTLVVAPTTAVKDQLLKDIRETTWVKLGVGERPVKEIVEIMPKTFKEVPAGPTIFVTTIQALLILKGKTTEFDLLRNKIDLVIFDEGHKEPADEWQTVIRSLNKKVVLYTATPLRNDQNKFKIDPDYIFSYPFQNARDQGYIRNINFECQRFADTPDVNSFAAMLLERYERYLQQEGLAVNDIKVIVRCGNAEDIKSMVNALKDKISVIGVHDKFKGSGTEVLSDKVPQDIRSSNIVFWIHQYKLIEGIDNFQFSMLGIYEPLPDPRSFIQQVGRVLREGGQSRDAVVLLLDNGLHQKAWWESYLEYERLISLNPAELFFKYEHYFERVKEANPSATYLEKKFLKSFSIETEEEVKEKLNKYQVPRKANVFELEKNIDNISTFLDTLLQQTTEELVDLDVLILDQFKVEDKQSACIIYSRYENSSILVRESFLEVKLELVILRVTNNKLYFYDSNQFIPSYLKKNWRRVSAKYLKKLFSKEMQFSTMSIQNGGISFNSFNRMIVNSEDVSRMVPDVTDKFNLCNTLVGSRKSEKSTPGLRRYVGFTNARISQETHAIPLNIYLDWLEEIDEKINTANHQDHAIFQRFAPVTDIPDTVTPASILFHFNTDGDKLLTWYGSTTDLDQKFYKITNSKFLLMWDENSYEVQITFSHTTGKYNLQFTDPENEPRLFVSGKKKTRLIDWLNEEQEFQIIVERNEYRYYMGTFYKVGVSAEYLWLPDIFDEIELPRGIKKINEKGDSKATVRKSMWDANSLFYLIAQKGANILNTSTLKTLLSNAEYVICTDLQTEIADFVTISETTKTVCFIHCKAGDSKLSASAFQEVCGQTVKNLDYVNPNSERVPYNIDKWDGDWTHKSYKVTTSRRIHNPGGLSSEEMWGKLKNIQNDPESKTFVIALMGNAFSKTRYLSEKRKSLSAQEPELIQIDYILNQTAVAVGRAQAKFMVAFNKV